MEELKTGFEWGVLDKVHPLDLKQWETTWPLYMESFYEEKIPYLDYLGRIKKCNFNPNSMPRKSEMFLNIECMVWSCIIYHLFNIFLNK